MTEEQLQKFYAMAEPRSEEAIRKAEERKKLRSKRIISEEDVDSYEETVKAALKYTLENLI